MGTQLWELANGIDNTDITQKYIPKDTSFSQGQVLMRDYDASGARLVIKEVIDELCVRLRAANLRTGCVSLFIGYSSTSGGGGLHHQCALDIPTDDNETLYEAAIRIFDRYIEEKHIRNVVVSMNKLVPYAPDRQLSLFEEDGAQERRRNLRLAIDQISSRYGRNAVLRASSLCADSTVIDRHGLIGGHHA